MESIIVMFDSKDKIINMSLYEFMDIEVDNDVPFSVCNVSKEEFAELVKQVNLGYLQERFPRLDFIRKPYNTNRYIAGYCRERKEITLSNPDDVTTGKYTIKDGILRYDEDELPLSSDDMANAFSRAVKIYTTESYRDIIKHYMLNKIDEVDPKKMNLKEVEMRICAVGDEINRLIINRNRFLKRRADILQELETPAEYFLKYSK